MISSGGSTTSHGPETTAGPTGPNVAVAVVADALHTAVTGGMVVVTVT